MTYHILGSPIRYIPPRFMVKNKTGITLSISAGDTISLSSVINSSLLWRVSVIRIYTSRKISSWHFLVTRLLDFISSGIVIRYIKLPSSFEKTWWKPTSNFLSFHWYKYQMFPSCMNCVTTKTLLCFNGEGNVLIARITLIHRIKSL